MAMSLGTGGILFSLLGVEALIISHVLFLDPQIISSSLCLYAVLCKGMRMCPFTVSKRFRRLFKKKKIKGVLNIKYDWECNKLESILIFQLI